MKRVVSILAPLLLVTASYAATAEWPQWRGPNRDARSAETGLLHEWGAAGPEVLWRVDVGEGFSGIAVAGGKLYTMWDEGGRQFLVGLDAASGERLWRRELGSAFRNAYGNGPRSTPVVDDGRVFAIGTSGRLLAVDARSGKLLWDHDLVARLGSRLPTYGYASSPIVLEDRLLVEVGGRGAAYAAFDVATGELLWRSVDDVPAYASPLHVSIGGLEQIVFWSANGVHAVSPGDGRELWSVDWKTNCPATGDPLGTTTPIFVAPDKLFLSSGSGAALIQVSSAGERKLSARTLWETEKFRNDVNGSVLLGDHVYGFDGSILKCIDVRTGEVRWQARGFRKGSLIAADGQLIVLGERGNLALVEANPSAFVQRATADVMSGRSWTAPALAAGRLYLRNHEQLVCLDLRAPKDPGGR
jgi:outer membrane protein assembly factor BamB